MKNPGQAAGPQSVSFRRDIAPILAGKCQACHGPKKAKGGYRVDTFERLLKVGDSEAPGVVPGDAGKSELFNRITTEDEEDRMPQDADALDAEQITLFREWIVAGALFDGADKAAPLASLLPPPNHPDPPEAYPRTVPITALAFHPKSSELFAGGYHEIIVWNASAGTLLRRIPREGERTHAIAISPDGRWVAAAGGRPGGQGEVRLFEAARGSLEAVLASANDVFLDAAFDPGGGRLAVAAADGGVRVIDVAGRKLEKTFPAHSDWVNAVAWNTDGTRLATASRDRTAKVYDLASGKSLAIYSGHGRSVRGVAFHPNGREVYTCGVDTRIHLWKIADGGKSRDVADLGGELFKITAAGDFFFVPTAGKRVRQYAFSNHAQVREFQLDDWALCAAVSHDGALLAAGGFDGRIHAWRMADGEKIAAFTAAPGWADTAAK